MTSKGAMRVFSEAVGVLNIRLGQKVASSSRRMVLDAEGPGGELLAVKVTLSAAGIDFTRFAIEYLVGSGMSHPNLLRTTGCGVAGGMPFLLMEHMPSTVEKLIADGPVEEEQAIHIVLQAARGVAALHEMSLTHGDLKPSNFLYDPETGQIKVCDFGSVTGADALIATSPGKGRTITPAFASPEQLLKGEEPGPASDVYALGMALLQLLSGRHPLASLPVGEVVKMHARGLEWDPGNLPARVQTVLDGCLEHDPHKRYRSAGELARALEQISSRAREGRPRADPDADQMQTLEVNGPLILIPNVTRRHPELTAATLALSGSIRDAIRAGHGQRQNQCAVLFHIADVKEDHADSDMWVTTIVETHNDSRCRSGRRQLSVSLGGPAEVEHVRSGGDGSASRTRLSGVPAKAAIAGLVVAVLLAVGAAVSVGGAWLAMEGSQETDTDDAGNSAPELQAIASLQVPADGGWFDTGVNVTAARTLVIEASGRAYFAGCCSSTPDGTDSTRVFPAGVDLESGGTWIAPNLPAHSLVGRIGDGPAFFVGWMTRLSPLSAGRLYLAMNDIEDMQDDNEGAWSVTVSTGQMTAAIPVAVPPQLFLHQGEDDGKLVVSGLAVQPGTRGYALFDLATKAQVYLIDADNSEFELPRVSPGETRCYFARALTTAGYGMATRSACATINKHDALEVDRVVQLPAEGASYAVAVTPDGYAVYAARGQTIFKLSASNLEIQDSARIPGDSKANIVDMTVEPETGRVVYVSGGPAGFYVGILDSNLNPVQVIEDPQIDFDRVVTPKQTPGLIYAVGGLGWLIIDSATLETKSRVYLQQPASTNSTVSADGRYIFGQKSGSASENTVYAFDSATGKEVGSFTFAAAGGGLHYTVASGVERLLLFAGDNSAKQNAYVLSVPDLGLVQTIDMPGLSWAAESQDGTYLLAVQNRALGVPRPATGLTLVKLRKDNGDQWRVSRDLELVAGSRVSGAHIAISSSLNKFFIPSPATGQLFAVSAR